VLVLPVVFALVFFVLCFVVFLTFFAGAVLFWSGVDWLGVAGAGVCAKIMGRLAAAKTMAIRLFFMLVSPCGIYCSRQLHLPVLAV
jgi:hypothetical protein